MPDLKTDRWEIPFPDGDDVPDVPYFLQGLAESLDDHAKDDQGPLSARPVSTPGSPGKKGRYYFATDQAVLYRDNGTGWTPLNTGKLYAVSRDFATGPTLAPVGNLTDWRTIPLTGGLDDPLGMSASQGFTLPVAGLWRFDAMVHFGTGSGNMTNPRARIEVNSTPAALAHFYGIYGTSHPGLSVPITLSGALRCSAGQNVKLLGGQQTVNSTVGYRFTATWIAP